MRLCVNVGRNQYFIGIKKGAAPVKEQPPIAQVKKNLS